MLDFNHGNKFHDRLNKLLDAALLAENEKHVRRKYLGGSRLGVECARALQYEYMHIPKDVGKDFEGRTLRIFAAGHVFEDLAIGWLRQAGFELYTENSKGEQFGFAVAGGRIQGHVDGIINNAPATLGMTFPALWEAKSLNNKSWNDTVKRGLVLSKPIYAAQVATYQAYMEATIPGISENPALFTAINKDTAEIYHELVPFDSSMAQMASDRGVHVLTASDARELLPRIASTPAFLDCKFCAWHDRCWRKDENIEFPDAVIPLELGSIEPCKKCGHKIAYLTIGKHPHAGGSRCASCYNFIAWLTKGLVEQLAGGEINA